MSDEITKRKVGRPSIKSPEVVEEIIERLTKGETMRSICNDSRMPSIMTIFRWESECSEFCELSARARERGTHQLADECIAIADDPELDPADKRVRIDTRIRLIGKWNQKKYGDKIEVEANQSNNIRLSFTIPHRDAPVDILELESPDSIAIQDRDGSQANNAVADIAEIEPIEIDRD